MTTDLLSSRLRNERRALNLKQKDLANRIGCDQAIISRIERGISHGTPEMLSAIARELKTTVSYLIGEEVRDISSYPADHPARQILDDTEAQGGLRDLACDTKLTEALRIRENEWSVLHSIKPAGTINKDGYVQLLIALRAVTRPQLSVTGS